MERTTKRRRELHEAVLRTSFAALDAGKRLPSLKVLARRCGATESELSRLLDGPLALRLALAAEILDQLKGHIDRAMTSTDEPWQRLRRGCRAYMLWSVEHPHRMRVLMDPELAAHRAHDGFSANAGWTFNSLVSAMSNCGALQPIPLAHTALMAASGFSEMYRTGRIVPPEVVAITTQIESVCDMIEAYVRTACGQASS